MEQIMRDAIMIVAVNHYGEKAQTLQCVEEMAELGVELIKDVNERGNREHIVEEYADTYIMIKQIAYIYNISTEELEGAMDKKLSRLLGRMEGASYAQHNKSCIDHCDNSTNVDMAYQK